MSISVVINTYNASAHLDKVLDAVKDFDEIVVCDMDSTDQTVEIARRHGARVVSFDRGEHTCCEPARNFAILQARSEWVLVVDADELVPAALRRHLYHYINGKRPANGLYIPRRNFIMARFRRATYPDYQLRFFRKDLVDWPPYVNSCPLVEGRLGKIPSNKMGLALIHIPMPLSGMLERLNDATTAEVAKEGNGRVTLLSLTVKPLARFLNAYFIRGGFRYGVPGFIAASHQAVYKLYQQGKIYEDKVKMMTPSQLKDEVEGILPRADAS